MNIKRLVFIVALSLFITVLAYGGPDRDLPRTCSSHGIKPMSQENFKLFRTFYIKSLDKAQKMLRPYLVDVLGGIESMAVFFEDSPEIKGLPREYAQMHDFLDRNARQHPEYGQEGSIFFDILQGDRRKLKNKIGQSLGPQIDRDAGRFRQDFHSAESAHISLHYGPIVRKGSVIAKGCVLIDQGNSYIKGCVSFDLVKRKGRGLKVINKKTLELDVLDAINHPAALLTGREQRIDGYSLSDLYERLLCSHNNVKDDPDLAPVLKASDLSPLDVEVYGFESEKNDNLGVFKTIAKLRGIDPKIFDRAEMKSFQYKTRQPEIFTMGSPLSEKGRSEYENRWTFAITEKYDIQVTPVTQLQWFLVMGENPSSFKAPDSDGDHETINGVPLNLNHPVESVSLSEAQDFIETLNGMDPDCSYRLPTETEWEAAARAKTSSAYFFGNDSGEKNSVLKQYAWFNDNSDQRTHAVARKYPNSDGLYDMIGNVWQWTDDQWFENFQEYQAHPSVFSIDPRRPLLQTDAGQLVAIRGGSWAHEAYALRSAHRHGVSSLPVYYNVGFRLIRICQ